MGFRLVKRSTGYEPYYHLLTESALGHLKDFNQYFLVLKQEKL